VGVRHQTDLVVTQLVYIKIVLADPGSKSGYQRLDLAVTKHFVKPSLFDVENFTLKRQNSLILAVAALFCRPTCRISLNQIKLGHCRGFFLTVCELTGQCRCAESAFADDLPRFPGGLAGTCGVNRLTDDLFGYVRMLFEIFAKFFIKE